jgi:hypothetical protein
VADGSDVDAEELRFKRKAKGQRPYFFDDPDIDRLLAMLMGLAGEVSVLRDRLDTVERLAAEKGLFSQADIEAYEPSEQVLAERARIRQTMLGEITRVVSSEIEDLEGSGEAPYEQAVELVERDNG